MSDRLEYPGNPLPSGLPGFGGGTVDVVVLPGFNRVVAAQKFGPVNDAPNVTVPDSVPPDGSNPEDPTNEVVQPAPAPPPVSSGGLNRKLDKKPPCEDIDGLFEAFASCDRKFKAFTVCENGEPKIAQIFIEETGFI